jgi:hypothetical protein
MKKTDGEKCEGCFKISLSLFTFLKILKNALGRDS